MKLKLSLAFLILIGMIAALECEAQRRARPGSMKHTEQEYKGVAESKAVKCTYVSNGHTFSGDAYVYEGGSGRIKIGTSTLSFAGGKYILKFKSDYFRTRPNENKRWRSEKLLNDFTQTGKYETFKKFDTLYLRLYEPGSDTAYMTDIPLSGVDAKKIEMNEEGLWFIWNLK